MIFNWSKFNESKSLSFNKDMAKEIIYYISEYSDPKIYITNKFYSIMDNEDFVMYDVSSDDIRQMIDKLVEFVNTHPDKKDILIQLYNEIRKINDVFPFIYEVEEFYQEFIDDDFEFMAWSSSSPHQEFNIELIKSKIKFEKAMEYSNPINNSLLRLKSNLYNTVIDKFSYQYDSLSIIIKLTKI